MFAARGKSDAISGLNMFTVCRIGNMSIRSWRNFLIFSFATSAMAATGCAPLEHKIGETFKDCAECPELVLVPAGQFSMGDLNGRGRANEQPVHNVKIITDFAVGKFEVTYENWRACIRDDGCEFLPSDYGWGRGRVSIVGISWNDTRSYLDWITRKTGKKYRLLSESEWEYVARAGSNSEFHWGDEIGYDNANCENCGKRWWDRVAPVGSFSPNHWGLFDVHGNAAEWVEDCWNDSYDGAPLDGSAWLSGNCNMRVLRGGAWRTSVKSVRLSSRNPAKSEERSSTYGFRVARDL